MLTEPFAEEDGRRVALALGARCGLRSHEVLDVAPAHVVDDGTVGTMLRVVAGKGDKPRETPIPATLAESVRTVGDLRDAGVDEQVVDRSTRTLRRWVTEAAAELQARRDGGRWRFLSSHDLRRTWAGRLESADVFQQLALHWGGWNDLDTIPDRDRGDPTPGERRREREEVGWLRTPLSFTRRDTFPIWPRTGGYAGRTQAVRGL